MVQATGPLRVEVGCRLHVANDALDFQFAPATDGDIAAINLASARRQSWSQFWRAPTRPGTAELIVEQEQLTAQFVGDLAAFDRLETLVDAFARAAPESGRADLVAGQVAGAAHRFAEARVALARATEAGAAVNDTERLALALDQATGANLAEVLATRRERAAHPGRWAELVPLGSLLVDLGEFDEADLTYLRALREYPDVSPFAVGWVCFQLGALWGECVPAPEPARAALWYHRAIDYLPCYVKARVHLAEILLDNEDLVAARDLLAPVAASGDPEVSWRLADVASAAGDGEEAASQLAIARAGFEALLTRHPLAFADHAAEFYLGSGENVKRALHLARLNLDNRPTARAFDLYAAAAERCGASHA
jgi:tetratricopeptide (TPR) repeat protein